MTSAHFATDKATAQYYDGRAGEYDDWYLGMGAEKQQERVLNDGSRHRVYKQKVV